MPSIPTLPRRLHGPSVWALYAIGLCPAAWYFYLGATGGLGVNPVKTFEHLLGIWALRFLIATLAITPLRDIGGINWLLVGAFQFDLVAALFGGQDGAIARIVYVLVGLSAIYQLIPFFKAISVGEVHAEGHR